MRRRVPLTLQPPPLHPRNDRTQDLRQRTLGRRDAQRPFPSEHPPLRVPPQPSSLSPRREAVWWGGDDGRGAATIVDPSVLGLVTALRQRRAPATHPPSPPLFHLNASSTLLLKAPLMTSFATPHPPCFFLRTAFGSPLATH